MAGVTLSGRADMVCRLNIRPDVSSFVTALALTSRTGVIHLRRSKVGIRDTVTGIASQRGRNMGTEILACGLDAIMAIGTGSRSHTNVEIRRRFPD